MITLYSSNICSLLRSFRNSNILAPICSRKYAYKSDLSLDKLYSQSRTKIFTPSLASNSTEKFNGYIPIKKLQITYSRSSGPGGQHVNSVNTKVDIRFKLIEADWISEKIKEKLKQKLHSGLTKEGYLVIKSDLTRCQHMNLADALEKLRNLVRKCEVEKAQISEDTVAQIQRRQEYAARERLKIKRQRSSIKSDRQGLTYI